MRGRLLTPTWRPEGAARVAARWWRPGDRWGLPQPSAVSADSTGAAGAFCRWVATEPRLPEVVTEGAKRTGEKAPDGRRTGLVELLSNLAALSGGKRRA